MTVGPEPSEGRREEAQVPPALRGVVTRVLRTGLLVAGAFFALAALGYGIHGEGIGPPDAAVGLDRSFLPALLAGDANALALTGLVVLLATPLTRVVVSAGLFAAAGDRAFTALTLFVLALILATFAVGILR